MPRHSRAGIAAAALIAAAFASSGCGGGGGGGGSSDWYYHWNCNGDSECLATNPTGQPSGTSGPISGGQVGCNELMTFGRKFWGIPPATQSCDNSPNGGGSATPTVSGVSPLAGAAGDVITITGTNLPTSAAGVSIDIGGVTLPASITVSSSTTLTFTWANNTSPFASVSGPVTLHTPAGQATSSATFTVLNDLHAVASSGTTFVAVGAAASAFTSSDGVHWASRATGADPLFVSLTSAAWVGGRFLAGGTNDYMYTSPDGLAWTQVPRFYGNSAGLNALNGIAFNGSKYAAAGTQSMIFTSSDGASWSYSTGVLTVDPSDSFQGILWANGQFVAVGFAILTSPDGVTWTQRVAPSTQHNGIAWSGSEFVAVSGGGYVRTSSDGVTWSLRSTGATTTTLSGVTWFDGKFVAVGHGGTVITSPDGVSWTAQTSGTSQDLYAVASSSTTIVAVGKRGVVISSSDGIAWRAGTATP